MSNHNPVTYAKWHGKAELLCLILYVIGIITIISDISIDHEEQIEMILTCAGCYFGALAVVNLISLLYRTAFMTGPFTKLKVIHQLNVLPEDKANGFARELMVKPVMTRDKMLKSANDLMMFNYALQSSFVLLSTFALCVFVYA